MIEREKIGINEGIKPTLEPQALHMVINNSENMKLMTIG